MTFGLSQALSCGNLISIGRFFSFEKLSALCLVYGLLWCSVYFSMKSCFPLQTMRDFYRQISFYHSLSTQIFRPSAGSGDTKTPDNFARYAIIIWTIILAIPPLLHSTAKLVKIDFVGDFNFQFSQIFIPCNHLKMKINAPSKLVSTHSQGQW